MDRMARFDLEDIRVRAERPRLVDLPADSLSALLADTERRLGHLERELLAKDAESERLAEAGDSGEWENVREEILDRVEAYRNLRIARREAREALWRRNLQDRIEQRLGGAHRARCLEYAILGLIVLVLVLLGVEEYDHLSPHLELTKSQRDAFMVVDTLICGAFLAEFFWRMRLADNKAWFFRRYWIEFASSLPLTGLLRIGRVARIARGARVLRLARAARLARLIRALRGVVFLFRGLEKVSGILRLHVVTRPILWTLVFLMIGGVLIGRFEVASDPATQLSEFGDGVWWAFTTAVVGGYGDIHNPQHLSARVLTVVLVIFGIILTGAVTAGLASILLGDDTARIERSQSRVEVQLARIEKTMADGDSTGA